MAFLVHDLLLDVHSYLQVCAFCLPAVGLDTVPADAFLLSLWRLGLRKGEGECSVPATSHPQFHCATPKPAPVNAASSLTASSLPVP